MTLCFTSRKLWRIMLRAAGPIVGRIYRYYIMYETTIKFQFSFLIQKRVLFYSLTQRSLPTSWGTWTSPERIGKRTKIFILKGLELFNMLHHTYPITYNTSHTLHFTPHSIKQHYAHHNTHIIFHTSQYTHHILQTSQHKKKLTK